MNKLGMILAISKNGVIGIDNKLPWDIKEDMKHFRNITSGHTIIMGRKTYESIGRPLPKRRNLVVSRNADLKIEGCEVFGSVEAATKAARETDECPVVIGGAAIYEAALPFVSDIWLTLIDRDVEGDTILEFEQEKQQFCDCFGDSLCGPRSPKNYFRFLKNSRFIFEEAERKKAETEDDVYFIKLEKW